MPTGGDDVSRIDSVQGDTAHVAPESGLSESIRRRLGWNDEEDTFQLPYPTVARRTGDETHLKA